MNNKNVRLQTAIEVKCHFKYEIMNFNLDFSQIIFIFDYMLNAFSLHNNLLFSITIAIFLNYSKNSVF